MSTGAESTAEGFVDVLGLEELLPNGRSVVFLGFNRVLLYRDETKIYAVSDLCPHALQPLSSGEISEGAIRCLKHGARFSLETGKPLNGVSNKLLPIHPVRVRDGRIEIAPVGSLRGQ